MSIRRNFATGLACLALALFLFPATAVAQEEDCDESKKDC